MNWELFFIGIVFLSAAYFGYRIRNWGQYKKEYKILNAERTFNNWVVIIVSALAGIVLIIRSFLL